MRAVSHETGQGGLFGTNPCAYDEDDLRAWLIENNHLP